MDDGTGYSLGVSAANVLSPSGRPLAETVLPASFRWEQDMLPPLRLALKSDKLCDKSAYVFSEVASVSGVPDLISVCFDEDEIERRLTAGLGPVEDFAQVRTLLALGEGGATIPQLADAAQASQSYMRQAIVPRLKDAGWIETILIAGSRAIIPRCTFRPVARKIVAIEAKRSAWQRALNQAIRHSASSDESFIALDRTRATTALSQHAEISKLGVGILTVCSRSGCVALTSRPVKRTPVSSRRAVLGERALKLRLGGSTEGPSYPVFGRDLTAATQGSSGQ